MKKLLAVLLAAVMCFTFFACGDNNNNNENEIDVEGLDALRIGVLSENQEQQMTVFETMHSRFANKGYKLEFVTFDSAEAACDALAAKEIDISLAADKQDFKQYDEKYPEVLLNLGAVYYSPYGLYLCNFESYDKIADGASVAVPSDGSGMARALLLLEKLGFIEVDDEAGMEPDLDDIKENSRDFEFVAQPADEIAGNLETNEVDMFVMSAESAKAAGCEVNRQAVAIEEYTDEVIQLNSYLMLLNKEDISSEKHKTVSPLYFSPMMYECIDDSIGAYIVPAFSIDAKG